MSWTPSRPDNDTAREPRVSKLVSLELSSDRHQRTKIVVRNLSPHGIGARGEIDLLPCERVTLHLPGDRCVAATVRWVRKGTFGLSLDERIDATAVQPTAKASAGLITRDAEVGFHRLRHNTDAAPRSGFQRSHRDEVLRNSIWTEN
ncbi:hypothetical protein GV829_08080 [Sphingomonas lacunae]|uniref:PilZ domain-containing protein n=1 Tax=Sphingomonas lacunae TaxID=2698828 RepID=A0A6M4ATQ2_9SPHN|nr:hypothetical protein [Sphingomonas lacunae]QJQ32414.1 hypothetical protein GV829_08080 [Sphingomonas lacunae]